MKGTRADIRLTELGLAASREKARALIMEGMVYIDEVRIDKAGEQVPPDAELRVRENANPFVSRGGLKLNKALEKYRISISGATALDIGASTGGFTDCMLKHGAGKVYAIDVGYGQLDWSLRNDPRVIVMERTNARNITPEWFDTKAGFASVDVSFISLKLILPGLYNCLADGAYAVVLVKPQFEAGRELVGKNGVVRSAQVHKQVLKRIADFAQELGFAVTEADYSPITGPKGNIEFLLILLKDKASVADCEEKTALAVAAAHEEFI